MSEQGKDAERLALRTPVGVATVGGTHVVVACDDGTVWSTHGSMARWDIIAPIPGTRAAAHTDQGAR